MARKVILDVDPGIDDAMAMCLALFNPRLEVLAVTAVSNPAEAERCEILVLGNGIESDSLPDLARAHKAGILTVGVWNEPREGTVIHLFREGSRVRFEISQSLAREAGLMISSKLLNLAREQSSQVSPELSEPRRG